MCSPFSTGASVGYRNASTVATGSPDRAGVKSTGDWNEGIMPRRLVAVFVVWIGLVSPFGLTCAAGASEGDCCGASTQLPCATITLDVRVDDSAACCFIGQPAGDQYLPAETRRTAHQLDRQPTMNNLGKCHDKGSTNCSMPLRRGSGRGDDGRAIPIDCHACENGRMLPLAPSVDGQARGPQRVGMLERPRVSDGSSDRGEGLFLVECRVTTVATGIVVTVQQGRALG